MPPQPLPVGRGEVLREGTDGVIWVIGTVARDALAAAERRADEGGQTWRSSMRVQSSRSTLKVPDVAVERLGIPDEFQPHGSQEILRARLDLDVEGIMRRARAFFPKTAVTHKLFRRPAAD